MYVPWTNIIGVTVSIVAVVSAVLYVKCDKGKNTMQDKINRWVKNKNVLYGAIILAAVCLYVMIYGVYILNPLYTDWLMQGGDITQHYLGWKAYRASEWMFPIGNTENLAYPYDTSIIFTDSIPLFAVFFKAISKLLPKEFQYFGLWGIICFILQGIFSARVIGRFTDNKLNIFLLSVLFMLSPVMIYRMYYHTALAGQWILLIAIENLFSCQLEKKRTWFNWLWIGALTVWIHTYFTLMCGIILCGYCIIDWLSSRKLGNSLKMLASYVSAAAFSAWILGGFSSIWGKWDAFGLGVYSMNVNALFNPQGWSRIYKDLTMCGSGQSEGFAYLGAGVIFLLFTAGLCLCADIRVKEIIFHNRIRIAALFSVCSIAFLVAASPSITFGEMQVIKLHVPQFVLDIWSVFRATGRVGWIIVYIVMFCSAIVLLKAWDKRMVAITVALCIMIQVWDIHDVIQEKNAKYGHMAGYETTMRTEKFWKAVAENEDIRNIIFLSTPDIETLYEVTDWAIDHGKTINDFCFARSLEGLVKSNVSERLKKPSENDLFIMKNRLDSEGAQLNYYMIDGYIIGYIGEIKEQE